jgi:DNA-binding PadR family transcriptional regulator
MFSAHSEEILLKFMKKAIENINICLASQYALWKFLVEKGILSESEMLNRIHDSRELPKTKLGAATLQDMLTPDWGESVNLQEPSNVEELNKIYQKIQTLEIPMHWKNDKTENPNQVSRRNAYLICCLLHDKYKILPDIVSSTIENGVYLRYGNGPKTFIVEAYNTAEIGGIVNKDKSILFSEEIQDFNFDNCVSIFMTA